MVAPVHKNTNAPPIPIVVMLFFVWGKNTKIGKFSGFFKGALTFLTPKLPFVTLRTVWGSKKSWSLEKPLEIANYVFWPQKKDNLLHD